MAQLSVNENEIKTDSSFGADLGADSLDQVELMIALEEEFSTPGKKITIPDEESEKMLTVQDAVDFLHGIGISDMQALPKPVEKTGFHKINIPKPSFSRPNLSRPNSPKSNLQRQDGQQNQQPNAGSQRGGQQRPDNRQRNDRKPQGNTSRPNNNSRQLQQSPKSLRQAPQKPPESGKPSA